MALNSVSSVLYYLIKVISMKHITIIVFIQTSLIFSIPFSVEDILKFSFFRGKHKIQCLATLYDVDGPVKYGIGYLGYFGIQI